MNRRLTQYNSIVYESGPIKFTDYINNNPNKIHIKLYEDALSKFIEHYCISQLIYNSLIYVKSEEFQNLIETLDISEQYSSDDFTSKISPEEFLHKFMSQNLTNDISDLSNLSKILLSNKKIHDAYAKFNKEILVYRTINVDSYLSHDVIFPNYNPPIINYINDTTFDYNTFINDAKENFRKNVYIIEKYNDEYWKPSAIIIFHNMSKMLDYYEENYLHICKQEVNLDTWWNHTQDKNRYKPQDVKIVRERLSNPQVKYLDYINGKAIMNDKSKPELDFNIDFDIINEDTDISDEYLLKGLFRTKLK